jgi:FAD/FMN-containing dehydrogenase
MAGKPDDLTTVRQRKQLLRKDTSMNPHMFAEFNHRIAGEVVVPGSPTYDQLRKVFNRAGSPAVIVRGQSTDDLVTALGFAREHHLALSVRSGGHGLSGLATNTAGLLLDLSAFNQVELLDPQRHLVRIGAGARWVR